MSNRRILDLLRTIFLVGALTGAATAVAWNVFYPRISKLDWTVVKLFRRGAEGQLEEAQALLEEGKNDAALAQLTALAEGLREVLRGDRLGTVRTEALDLLGDTLQKAGRLEESLDWTDELLAFDERDFVAMLRRAQLLEALGREGDALAQMREVFRIGSTSGEAQLTYFEALARRGLTDELVEGILGLGRRGPLVPPARGFELRWSDTESFVGKARVPVEPRLDAESGLRRVMLTPEAPGATVRAVRLDLPPGSLPILDRLRVRLRTQAGDEVVLGPADVIAARDLDVDGTRYVAKGGEDPYIVLEPAAPLAGVVALEVDFTLSMSLPPTVRAALAGGLPPEGRAHWIERYGRDAVEALEAAIG